VSESWETSQVS